MKQKISLSCLLSLFLFLPCCTTYPKSEISKASDNICATFIKQVLQQHPQLYAVGSGGGVDRGKITRLQVAFQIDSFLTIDEGRKLMLQLVKDLENTILTTPEFLAWFENKEAVLGTLYLSIHGGCPNQDEMNKRIMSW